MKVIVGLGNPGHTFYASRHNVGFRVIETLAKRRRVDIRSRLLHPSTGRPAGVFGEYRVGQETVHLVMPLTMMNESGDALRALQVPREQLLVVCDDANLPLGRLRLRAEGGAGGHHGLASCLAVLGTEAVPRLRVGVGVEPLPADLTNFVLGSFAPEERAPMAQAFEQAADACERWVSEGLTAAMNRYNTAQDA